MVIDAGRLVSETEDLINQALEQGDYVAAALAALKCGILTHDGTPYFERRGLSYAILAAVEVLAGKVQHPVESS